MGVEDSGDFGLDMGNQPEITPSLAWAASLYTFALSAWSGFHLRCWLHLAHGPLNIVRPGRSGVRCVATADSRLAASGDARDATSDSRSPVIFYSTSFPAVIAAQEAPTAPLSCPSVAMSTASFGAAISSLVSDRSGKRSRREDKQRVEAAVSTLPSARAGQAMKAMPAIAMLLVRADPPSRTGDVLDGTRPTASDPCTVCCWQRL